MSKIICDICGTSYPDTADCCPICGCSKDSAMDFLGEDFRAEEMMDQTPERKSRTTERKRKEIFDYDEVNSVPRENQTMSEELPDEEEEEVYEDRPRSNLFAVIAMTVLIAGLLLTAGFLFFRYILPNLGGDKPEPTTPAVVQTEPTTASTGYEIPCQNIALVSGTANLTQEGQYHLINVSLYPEDTTDVVTYASADESIATVNENGQVTAVSEGETVIYITCGDIQITCNVVVSYQQETTAATEQTLPETEPAEVETTAATEETKDPAIRTDVTLKLKKKDIMLGVYYEYQLELDCDLKPEEVQWSAEHPHIVSVSETGMVKALKSGVTDVIVKYGDQEVRCKVRCS